MMHRLTLTAGATLIAFVGSNGAANGQQSLVEQEAARERPSTVIIDDPLGQAITERARDPADDEADALGAGDLEPLDATLRIDARNEIRRAEANWRVAPISDQALAGHTDNVLSFQQDNVAIVPATNSRGHTPCLITWQPPATRTGPNHFEDVDLERYGHVRCAQPWRSGWRFYADVLMLPVAILQPPSMETRFDLGHERPGTITHSVRKSYFPRLDPKASR